jgi:predicted transcriptional regulator
LSCSIATRVAQLAEVFGVSEAAVCNWLKQDRIDRGEVDGLRTDQALELAATKRRIRQLEIGPAVAQKECGSWLCE